MEYFAVFDRETGVIRWQGSGPAGTAGSQALPDGAAALAMPYDAFVALPDLTPLKKVIQGVVDAAAGQFRSQFITAIPGQAETYMYKADEARAWMADHAAATPMMTPEAAARGMTVEALATEVLANEAAWLGLGGRIEGARVGAKMRIEAAGTIAAIVDAATIDWPALLA